MSTTTASAIIETMVNDVTAVLFDIIPVVLVAASVFLGISIGVKYAVKWIKRTAR